MRHHVLQMGSAVHAGLWHPRRFVRAHKRQHQTTRLSPTFVTANFVCATCVSEIGTPLSSSATLIPGLSAILLVTFVAVVAAVDVVVFKVMVFCIMDPVYLVVISSNDFCRAAIARRRRLRGFWYQRWPRGANIFPLMYFYLPIRVLIVLKVKLIDAK